MNLATIAIPALASLILATLFLAGCTSPDTPPPPAPGPRGMTPPADNLVSVGGANKSVCPAPFPIGTGGRRTSHGVLQYRDGQGELKNL